MVYDNETNTENDNVLKYIYKLKEHLDNLTYLWQGLAKKNDNSFIRIAEPIAPDPFIYSQISALGSVLSPQNFASQIKSEEKKNIILDTFTSFLETIEKEPEFNWDRFHMAQETFYNTLHLFLNSIEGGFGAQFTIAAQSGITSRIPVNGQEVERVPYVDVPGIFGFDKNKDNNSHSDQPVNNNYDDNGRNNY